MARVKHTTGLGNRPLVCPDNSFHGAINGWLETCETPSSDFDSFIHEQEEAFHIRPSIRIVMPDNLKALIVDDWERISKNNSVVKLPAEKSIRQIFQDWRDEEEPKRKDNRIDTEVLDEVIAGMMEYFDKMLDKILLYRYERPQFRMLRKKHQPTPGNGPVDVYGAEHLIRLFSMLVCSLYHALDFH